jgi:hypothetical protein
MACLRLFTVPPLPPLPDFKVPRFFLRIALSTLLPAASPYFGPADFLAERFVAAIVFLLVILQLNLVEKNICEGCRVHLCRQHP